MMKILKCWEWLTIFTDDFLPPSPKPPNSSPDLCDDVLIDILLQLPPKDLSRFKCVNKQSRRVIDDPDFIHRYRSQWPNYQPYPLAGLFYQHDHQSNLIGFANVKKRGSQFCMDNSLEFLPHPVRILSSRHGLMLCISAQLNPVQYYVCNPITKLFALLPMSKGPFDKYSTGFFVDCSFGDYKVIRIQASAARNSFPFVETFSSETGEWKLSRLELSSPYCLFPHTFSAVQWNGSLHWVDGLGSILAYDVSKEKFSFFELPSMNMANQRQCKREVINHGVLGVSGGFLSYAFSDKYSLRVWMRDVNNWVGTWKVSLGSLVSSNLEVLRRFDNLKFASGKARRSPLFEPMCIKPVCFHEFDMRVLFLKVPGWVVSYHIERGKIEAIQDHSEENEIEVVLPYVVPQLPFAVDFQSFFEDRLQQIQD